MVIRLVSAALAGGMVWACGAGGTETDEPTNEFDPFGAAALASVSEFQKGILEDGRVDPEEYERSFFAYVRCLEEQGVPHGIPEFKALGNPPRWTITLGPYPEDRSDEVRQIDLECAEEYRKWVELAWQAQEGPTEKEFQSQLQDIVECFNERTGREAAHFDEIRVMLREQSDELSAVYIGCQQLIRDGETDAFR